MFTMDFEAAFRKAGAFWKHDEKLKRPFAELTTRAADGRRRISDGFFNADRIARRPGLMAQAVGHLLHHPGFIELLGELGGGSPIYRVTASQSESSIVAPDRRFQINRIAGAAYGGITLAHEAARHIGCDMAYAIKKDDELSFERFVQDFVGNETLQLVEDTLTTGGTMRKARAALAKEHPSARILPCVLALCNRSGKAEAEGMKIFSLITPEFKVWNEGENPYTKDGKELTEPLRPKGKNWEILNAEY